MNEYHFQMITGLAPIYYLATNPDVVKAGGKKIEDAVYHYERYGKREGRSPNPFFNPRYYMDSYGDLRTAFGETNYERALQHWIEYGVSEGRRGIPSFHLKWYVDHHGDLKQAFGNDYIAGLGHWLTYGNKEGRLTAPDHITRLVSAKSKDASNVWVASASKADSPDFFTGMKNFVSTGDPDFFKPFNTTGGRIGFSTGVLVGLYFSGGDPVSSMQVGLVGGLTGHYLDRLIVDATKITGPAWKDLEHSRIGKELGNFGGAISDGAKDVGKNVSDAFKKIFP